jgi:hypothetical protein
MYIFNVGCFGPLCHQIYAICPVYLSINYVLDTNKSILDSGNSNFHVGLVCLSFHFILAYKLEWISQCSLSVSLLGHSSH